MATASIQIGKRYKILNFTAVYNPVKRNGVTVMQLCGTMDSGARVYFTGETIRAKATNGKDIATYGVIDAKDAPGYVSVNSYGNGQTISSAGKYINIESGIAEENTGKATTSATDLTGHEILFTNIELLDPPPLYTVKTGCKWPTYTGPDSVNFSTKTVYTTGKQVRIYATFTDSNGNVWGSPSSTLDRWGLYMNSAGQVTNNLAAGNVTTVSDSTIRYYTYGEVDGYASVVEAKDVVNTNIEMVTAQYLSNSGKLYSDSASNAEKLSKMQYVIGIPPRLTRTADPVYMTGMEDGNDFGRNYIDMFMMTNTVFSIQPCKVKYLPTFTDEQKESFIANLASAVNGGDADKNLLHGQLFESSPDYGKYINTVNALARAMSIYMGIGKKSYRGRGPSYQTMDYAFYNTRSNYPHTGEWGSGSYGDEEERISVGDMITSIINDDTYIHFYMTADGTSINESMRVSTKSSSIESLFNNQLSELAKEIEFLGATDSALMNGITSGLNGVADSIDGVGGDSSVTGAVANLLRYGGNYLKGGRLVFPQMLDDCTYDRSYTGTCRFIAPCGDPEAIFLYCYLPICYLLPFVLPQQLSDNMYRYPFLAKVNSKGLFHSDLAAITNLKINRGGQDGTCWTADGLPFEVDVSFDVTPLYSKLMVTGTQHPLLFIDNNALNEYLGSMCGISFTGNQLKVKSAVAKALLNGAISGVMPSILRSIYGSDAANLARKIFNF